MTCSFESLNIAPTILNSLKSKGYENPTPIQQKAIPVIMQGSDVFASAQTGTGKTAAFAIPILQLLSEKTPETKGIRALILAPTRELAQQIGDSFYAYGKGLSLQTAIVYGGVPQHKQTTMLKKNPDILIATPGRLLDLVDQRYVKLQQAEILVLDEADRMMDMGFIDDIKTIISHMKNRKQTLLFSATAPAAIRDLVKNFLNEPVNIKMPLVISDAVVKHSIYHVGRNKKFELLQHVLKNDECQHVMVFTRTKKGADSLTKSLNNEGIRSLAIHGDKSQNERLRNLSSFKSKKVNVLVATDVAARGIDVKALSHVINFDIPFDTETYVHRTGRTGRAGASGIALTFCEPGEGAHLRQLKKVIGSELEVVHEHPFVQKKSADFDQPQAERSRGERGFQRKERSFRNDFGAPKKERSFRRNDDSSNRSFKYESKPFRFENSEPKNERSFRRDEEPKNGSFRNEKRSFRNEGKTFRYESSPVKSGRTSRYTGDTQNDSFKNESKASGKRTGKRKRFYRKSE